jgi:hypothetical protein
MFTPSDNLLIILSHTRLAEILHIKSEARDASHRRESGTKDSSVPFRDKILQCTERRITAGSSERESALKST